MKTRTTWLACWLLVACIGLISCESNTTAESEAITVIRTNDTLIHTVINGTDTSGWYVVPEAKPDRLQAECQPSGKTKVEFLTATDAIAFEVGLGDTIQFYVLLNTDSALTEIVGVPKNVNFSDEYIQAHRGKLEVEIPEVHELANIMVALSAIGQKDSNMVDMTTEYYQDVMEHFGSHKDHPAIDVLNEHIVGVMDMDSYSYYYSLKMNACGYLFDDQGNIVDDNIIHFLGFGDKPDPFVDHSQVFQDFALQSEFRDFYDAHGDYYRKLIKTYEELNPIDKMQRWLEAKFNRQYGNYRVTFSPLVGGAHSTQQFWDNDFSQTIMFVSRAVRSENHSRDLNEMLQSRVVFTEIDHNFVNPLSNEYVEAIDQAMSVRETWVAEGPGTKAYGSPYAVFNEYMTWALFSLYCYDLFPSDDADKSVAIMENQMIESRSFIRFRDFNQQLIEHYHADSNITIDTLYDRMLTWCETVNAESNE